MAYSESSTGDDARQMSAVSRTITVLETLARHSSVNLENLAKETQLPKATLLRFLSTLTSLGYVHKDSTDRYSLTLRMFSVGSHVLSHIDLLDVARPFASELCERFGETVHMGILTEDEAVYILKKESSYTVRMYSRVGKTIPLYCTAIGKILLAGMDATHVSDYLARTALKPFTPKTLRTPGQIFQELDLISARGWAMDDEEHEEGVVCIGAGIHDYTGRTVAAMSVSWPLFRFVEINTADAAAIITDTCGRISRILGRES
ncbi:IclR family transcriptional regulator [Parasphaerochaeta coccoides]|uniref:Transcriptional regulator, IclR family n=1 Tax=Parasphaerochaeta coccoides (strain ATCC BAA-1237 / DSM 17374 / SPN1) TaxID=760011 RepID=F4GIZ2_PARC1|nr:IclR family transcriptional regulator [Parasphaerochaeta coccoides]AEC01287.1 transcriptional regulator, IclR family [Parasphaerochaeta coccoides DSM 17374]